MWYSHASRIGPVVTGQPDSSLISLATQSSGCSPTSSFPPGNSHSSRSLRASSTRPSTTTTPLQDTGNARVGIGCPYLTVGSVRPVRGESLPRQPRRQPAEIADMPGWHFTDPSVARRLGPAARAASHTKVVAMHPTVARYHIDPRRPDVTGAVLGCLATHGIATVSGVVDRHAALALAWSVGMVVPHRYDSADLPDGNELFWSLVGLPANRQLADPDVYTFPAPHQQPRQASFVR